MALTRFQTNWRLWRWTAAALFAVAWLVPVWSFKAGAPFPTILLLWMTLGGFWDPDTPVRQLAEPAAVLAVFTAGSGVAAISIGWVMHSFLVIIRTRRKRHGKPPG